jgi:steroid delta-isomerase-like uncharacterized protein
MSAPVVDLGRATADLIEAFNRADWDSMRAHLTPDVHYEETGTGRRVDGADPYIALCQGWREAFPDVAGTVRTALTGDGIAVLEIGWEGTHTGPLETPGGSVAATGNRVSIEASFWARYEGDRIADARHHVDVLMLLQQVGALPG